MFKVINKYLSLIKCNLVLVISLISTFVVGLILGLIFYGYLKQTYLLTNIENYYCNLYCYENNLFIYCLNKYFLTSILCFLLSFTIINLFLISINYLVVLYKGFIVGAIFITMLKLFSITGLIIYIFVILPSALLFLCAVILICLNNINEKKRLYVNNKLNFGLIINNYFICEIIILISFLIEFLIILIFIKPFSIYF